MLEVPIFLGVLFTFRGCNFGFLLDRTWSLTSRAGGPSARHSCFKLGVISHTISVISHTVGVISGSSLTGPGRWPPALAGRLPVTRVLNACNFTCHRCNFTYRGCNFGFLLDGTGSLTSSAGGPSARHSCFKRRRNSPRALLWAVAIEIAGTCPCGWIQSWMFTEYSLNVHWMIPGCSLNAPWVLTEFSLDVPWMFTGCSLNVHLRAAELVGRSCYSLYVRKQFT
jgi:hypothetical protein